MTGRNVEFRLTVIDDPKNKDALGRFAAEHAKTQKAIDEAGINGAKKVAQAREKSLKAETDNEEKERVKLAGRLLDRQIKDADILAARQRKDADRDFEYRRKLTGQLLNQQIKDAEKLARETERNAARAARTAQHNARLEMTYDRRREAGVQRVAGGAIRAIGGIGGYIGGDTGSALANTALGAHVAMEAYHGGRGILGGIGSIRSGGALAAGSGAAVASGISLAAPVAAVVAALAALTSVFFTARDAIKYGLQGGGDYSNASGKRGVNFGRWLQGAPSMEEIPSIGNKADLEAIAHPTGIHTPIPGTSGWFSMHAAATMLAEQKTKDLERNTEREIEQRRKQVEELKAGMGQSFKPLADWSAPDFSAVGKFRTAADLGRGSFGSSSFFSREQIAATEEHLGGLRQSQIHSDYAAQRGLRNARFGLPGLNRDMAGAVANLRHLDAAHVDEKDEVRVAAVEKVKNIEGQILASHREENTILLQSAQSRLASAKEEYQIKKQMADEAKRSLQSDVVKFALSSPEERERVRGISLKQQRGQHLSRGEIQEAQGYSSFRQYGEKEAERIAYNELHAEGVFGSQRKEVEALSKSATGAGKKAQEAEKQAGQQELENAVVGSDQALAQVVLKNFASFLKSVDEKEQKLRLEVDGDMGRKIAEYANTHRR